MSDLFRRLESERIGRYRLVSDDFFRRCEDIPDLDFMPSCAICGSPDMITEDGTHFDCDICAVRWPASGYGSEAQRLDADGEPVSAP